MNENKPEKLTRANLKGYFVRYLHRAQNWIRADILLVEVDRQMITVKDISRRSFLMRVLFGRLALQREFRILKEMDNLKGVPRTYKMLDKDAFVMDYIEGKSLKESGIVSNTTIQQLTCLFDKLHGRGIAHGDPNPGNILLTTDGVP